MPKLRVALDERGVHHIQVVVDSPFYKMGQQQAELSTIRYHTLVAALTKKYTYTDTPINLPNYSDPTGMHIDAAALVPGSRQTINLSSYKGYKLEPIPNVKLHPRVDGTINPGDLSSYRVCFEDNWKTQEGGILYCLAESREFWNCLISYHGPIKSTGIKEWDELFHRLESTGYAKNIIPCMFFGREAGCVDKNCPFLHDRAAVLANRAKVLAKRRETFGSKITPSQRFARERMIVAEAGQDQRRREAFMLSARYNQLKEKEKNVLVCCANPTCLKPWFKSEEDFPLLACSKCKFTFYCSTTCQRADWKRHKNEPCATIEEIVNDDDLWNPIGTRKGTEYFNVDWGHA